MVTSESLPFDVIVSGTVPPNPGELIGSEKNKELLEALREKYE